MEKKYGIERSKHHDHKTWLKKNYVAEFLAFQSRLNICFSNHSILMTAFAHPSFSEDLNDIDREQLSVVDHDLIQRFQLQDEISKSNCSYQSLSLLGYETTLLAIKEELYAKYPNMLRTICDGVCKYLISRHTVSTLAYNLAVEDLLLLSRELDAVKDFDTEYHLQFTKEDLLCDTFFGVVGAIVKDQKLEAARSFVKDFLLCLINYEDLSKYAHLSDVVLPKLVNILRKNGVSGKPDARTLVESGMDTGDNQLYYIGVYVHGCQIATGSSYSLSKARDDGFRNAIFNCLEGEVDFHRLRTAGGIVKELQQLAT